MTIHYGREYFKRVLIFRPHNVFGPNMGWDHVIPQFVVRLQQLKTKATGQEISFSIQGKGDQTRAFIYIEDFIAGLMLVIRGGTHLNTYNIGTTAEIAIRDVADKIAHCMGLDIRIVAGPEAAGGTPRRCPDISKLRKLGFEPRFAFDQVLPITVQWYMEHPEPMSAVHATSQAKILFREI
jgi:nucleoside-diphosphate-sugar epimerase